jgi:hypothetical protein
MPTFIAWYAAMGMWQLALPPMLAAVPICGAPLVYRRSGSLFLARAVHPAPVRIQVMGSAGVWRHGVARLALVDCLPPDRHPARQRLVDLDRFKSINDNFGHAAGDHVLQSVAAGVQGELRQQDCFGRYGGEEFLLLLKSTDLAGSGHFLERIRRHRGLPLRRAVCPDHRARRPGAVCRQECRPQPRDA